MTKIYIQKDKFADPPEIVCVMQQKYYTALLHARGLVFLSEVFNAFGIPLTAESVVTGWILDPADKTNEIIFDLKEESDTEYSITFNTDGLIWNLIEDYTQ